MKLNILDVKGASVGEYSIDDSCLEFEKGTQAVHDTVIAILAGERAGTASTKTRGEVRGGGKKPWKQKGLGRARTGSIRNPIWRGGGITFGPRPRSFAKKINKKVRVLALRRAFSERLKENSVIMLNSFDSADSKTKSMKSALDNLKVIGNVLIIVDDYTDVILKAACNLSESFLIKAGSVNVYQMLRFKNVLFTKAGMDTFINTRLSKVNGGVQK
ncbi:MAG: 50S ribosomal protein L4 [Lentisphaerae bacterium GWF2_45_14]|nr:MAG: 50S ribosomal protein L4 [Lentisphaerae bacterium GWF2_45_14]